MLTSPGFFFKEANLLYTFIAYDTVLSHLLPTPWFNGYLPLNLDAKLPGSVNPFPNDKF